MSKPHLSRLDHYRATVTNVEDLGGALYGVRCRLSDGQVWVIVIPKGLVTVENVLLATQAVMDIVRIDALGR